MKIIKISSGLPETKNLLLRQTENFSGVWEIVNFSLMKILKNVTGGCLTWFWFK